MNKTIVQVLKKIILENQRNSHKKLNNTLWESRITPKERTCQSCYLLFYGKESILPINLEIHALSLDFQVEETDPSTSLQSRYFQLMQIEEKREKVITAIEERWAVSKIIFDEKVTLKIFVKDQYVLLWNKEKEKPSMNNKFEALWIGPY